jgi:hypothetical protein
MRSILHAGIFPFLAVLVDFDQPLAECGVYIVVIGQSCPTVGAFGEVVFEQAGAVLGNSLGDIWIVQCTLFKVSARSRGYRPDRTHIVSFFKNKDPLTIIPKIIENCKSTL